MRPQVIHLSSLIILMNINKHQLILITVRAASEEQMRVRKLHR